MLKRMHTSKQIITCLHETMCVSCVQEFHSVALVGVRKVRELAVTRWMYKNEINKAVALFKREAGDAQPLLMPDRGDHVVYLKQGHVLHLEHFPREYTCINIMYYICAYMHTMHSRFLCLIKATMSCI